MKCLEKALGQRLKQKKHVDKITNYKTTIDDDKKTKEDITD